MVIVPPAAAASGRKTTVIKIPLPTEIRRQMTETFSELTIHRTANVRTAVGYTMESTITKRIPTIRWN